jgi:hypothetical protein
VTVPAALLLCRCKTQRQTGCRGFVDGPKMGCRRLLIPLLVQVVDRDEITEGGKAIGVVNQRFVTGSKDVKSSSARRGRYGISQESCLPQYLRTAAKWEANSKPGVYLLTACGMDRVVRIDQIQDLLR